MRGCGGWSEARVKQASTQTVCLLNNMLCKQYLYRMPALRQFYNREREISRIRSALDRDRHQFIVVYGRRRCGKSTLLTEKILGPNDVYLHIPAKLTPPFLFSLPPQFLNSDPLVCGKHS